MQPTTLPTIHSNINLAKSEVHSFDGFVIYLRHDDIIEIDFCNGFYGELTEAKQIVEMIKEISKGKKYPLLVVYADDNLFSKEAREFVSSHTYTSADALVGFSMALRLIGNFYLNFNKPVRPTKLFDNIENAVKWLEQFKI